MMYENNPSKRTNIHEIRYIFEVDRAENWIEDQGMQWPVIHT